MKQLSYVFIVCAVVSGFLFVPQANALWGIEVPTIAIPALPTLTPSPIPTMKIFLPGKVVLPVATIASTATPTVTPAPSATPTISMTPSVTGTVLSPTVHPASDSSQVNPALSTGSAAQPAEKTQVAGFLSNQVLAGVIISLLLVSLILQGNWARIKKWLHDKTG